MIVTQREEEAETQAEGEAGSMHREPDSPSAYVSASLSLSVTIINK